MNINHATAEIASEDRLVASGAVLSRLDIHFTTLWRKVKNGRFPQPWAKIGGRNYWRASDVDAYLQQQHERTVREREEA